MDRANIGNWSQHLARQRAALDWWQSEHPRATRPVVGRRPAARDSATGMLSFFRKDSVGPGTTKTKSPLDTKAEPPLLDQPPSTGRTTPLGRKVERPADGSAAGPSGQKDRINHERKHTNK